MQVGNNNQYIDLVRMPTDEFRSIQDSHALDALRYATTYLRGTCAAPLPVPVKPDRIRCPRLKALRQRYFEMNAKMVAEANAFDWCDGVRLGDAGSFWMSAWRQRAAVISLGVGSEGDGSQGNRYDYLKVAIAANDARALRGCEKNG